MSQVVILTAVSIGRTLAATAFGTIGGVSGLGWLGSGAVLTLTGAALFYRGTAPPN